MKKFIAMAIAIALLLTIAGCGSNDPPRINPVVHRTIAEPNNPGETNPATPTEPGQEETGADDVVFLYPNESPTEHFERDENGVQIINPALYSFIERGDPEINTEEEAEFHWGYMSVIIEPQGELESDEEFNRRLNQATFDMLIEFCWQSPQYTAGRALEIMPASEVKKILSGATNYTKSVFLSGEDLDIAAGNAARLLQEAVIAQLQRIDLDKSEFTYASGAWHAVEEDEDYPETDYRHLKAKTGDVDKKRVWRFVSKKDGEYQFDQNMWAFHMYTVDGKIQISSFFDHIHKGGGRKPTPTPPSPTITPKPTPTPPGTSTPPTTDTPIKDPTKDPVNQGNADTGGGKNEDPGPGKPQPEEPERPPEKYDPVPDPPPQENQSGGSQPAPDPVPAEPNLPEFIEGDHGGW